MKLTPEINTDLAGKCKNIATGFVVMLICTIGMQAFLSLFMNIPTLIPHRQHLTVVGFFFTCIVAPLWEELAFRVIPITIAKVMNTDTVVPVVLLSSLIFGWGHGSGPMSLLFQGVLGFIFSVVYIKNNYSYLSAVVLHAFWNFFCFLFF
jgi:membrane protease YdiL (CAAX protease family)